MKAGETLQVLTTHQAGISAFNYRNLTIKSVWRDILSDGHTHPSPPPSFPPPSGKESDVSNGRFRGRVWACMAWGLPLSFHNLVPENCTHYWAPLAPKINSKLESGWENPCHFEVGYSAAHCCHQPIKRSRALLEVKLMFWLQYLSLLSCSGWFWNWSRKIHAIYWALPKLHHEPEDVST